jgi:hypothetical protein
LNVKCKVIYIRKAANVKFEVSTALLFGLLVGLKTSNLLTSKTSWKTNILRADIVVNIFKIKRYAYMLCVVIVVHDKGSLKSTALD